MKENKKCFPKVKQVGGGWWRNRVKFHFELFLCIKIVISMSTYKGIVKTNKLTGSPVGVTIAEIINMNINNIFNWYLIVHLSLYCTIEFKLLLI